MTGAPVLMKDGIKTEPKQSLMDSSVMDTRTMFTTFTYFTTYFTDDTSVVSSSEQTVTNVVTVPIANTIASEAIAPTMVVKTSERLRTETIYSTYTYFATLFNGSSSTITLWRKLKQNT